MIIGPTEDSGRSREDRLKFDLPQKRYFRQRGRSRIAN
jgi:hypothetical protein